MLKKSNMITVKGLNEYTKFLDDNNSLSNIKDVINIPNLNLTTKVSRRKYKIIRLAAIHFNRQFDNTVVDTYAFYKVLHSESFTNALYYFLYESKYDVNHVKEVILDYTVLKVKELYQNTNHSIFNLDVYNDYIKQLIDGVL